MLGSKPPMTDADPSPAALSVVVPVYNGAATLPALLARLGGALAGSSFEVVLVDDASQDESWPTIERLAAQQPRVRGLRLSRNFGQHAALLCGVRAARGATIVTLDDDLQHPPEEIGRLLAKLAEGYDVVYGTPRVERHSGARRLAAWLVKAAARSAMGVALADEVSAFRAFRADLRRGFDAVAGPYVSLDVLLSWSARRYATVPIEHQPRARGRAGYGFRRLAAYAFDMLTGFSAAPLRLASLLGFACTLFGLGVLAWVVGRYFTAGDPVPGFPFLASIIAIFSGTQLFALGVLGEYVARLHFRAMGRPAYVVAETTAGEAAP